MDLENAHSRLHSLEAKSSELKQYSKTSIARASVQSARPACSPATTTSPSTSGVAACQAECVRAALLLQLRKAFDRKFQLLFKCIPANETLNAWLFVQISRSHLQHQGVDEHLFVPLAAPEGTRLEWPLIKYLERVRDRGGNEHVEADAMQQARQLDAWLREQWQLARQQLAEAIAAACHPSPESGLVVRSHLAEDGALYVAIEPPVRGQQCEHSVNAETLLKLRSGYVGGGDGGSFEADLWLMLHRYSSLFGPRSGDGRGWQLATPPAAMECFCTDFGVELECFASPLNRSPWNARFCSAFADTDRAFGSLGNFFSTALHELQPPLRSVECGPPYDDEVMEAAVARIEELLMQPRSSLESCVFVVPDWPGPFRQRIAQSDLLSREEALAKSEHRYRDGFQHRRGGKRSHAYVLGECDTLLAWLQNLHGAGRFRVTEEKVCRLRSAWKGE